uniref:Uncharacterized protein n=1 Tax=Glossina pallidipes TaxID=7398 RepID=A0A1A9ZS49_GLOPL
MKLSTWILSNNLKTKINSDLMERRNDSHIDCKLTTIDEIDGYLYYLGGTVGAITIAGIAAASAYYFMTRPIPEKPLVPLENQSPILEAEMDDLIVYLFTPSLDRRIITN